VSVNILCLRLAGNFCTAACMVDVQQAGVDRGDLGVDRLEVPGNDCGDPLVTSTTSSSPGIAPGSSSGLIGKR
jgi:hypothetical protein